MHNRTTEALMLSALVPFQITKLTKSFIAHIALMRFLVKEYACDQSLQHALVPDFQRLNDEKTSRTHHIRTVSRSCEYACEFAKIRSTKSLLAHITFVRSLVRVNTHVVFK